MIKIVEGGTPRNSLNEGRQQGFGSTLLKKIKKDEYQTLMGMTTCKDYLHDVLAAEYFNEPVGVYGLRYKPQKPFSGLYCYYAIEMLQARHGHWDKFDEERKALSSNIKGLQEFINYCETKLGCKRKTTIHSTSKEGVWLIKAPMFWVSTTYLISLYTLLLRVAYRYDLKQNPEDYVKEILVAKWENGDWGVDINMLKDVWPKVNWLAENGCPKENMEKRQQILGMSHGWHNAGIMATSFEPKSKWLE